MGWPKGKSRKGGQGTNGAVADASIPDATPAVEATTVTEVRTLHEVVSVPAVSHAEAIPDVPVKAWLVSLPHNPELRVEAPTREQAVAEYFRLRNIVRSRHAPVVKEVA